MTDSINTLTRSKTYTTRHSPGFTERLSIVLNKLGVISREHVSLVSSLTGLSIPGTRSMLQQDRPPKHEAFNKLALSLTELLKDKDIIVNLSALSDYLLTDSKSPFATEISLNKFLEKDPVLLSQLILKIEHIAEINDISTSSEFDPEMTKLIYYRIADYVFKNNVALDSDKLANNILSLLQISKENLI